jgi:transcriptional regulator with GAF, ATPase, and Fis domain
VSIRSKDQRSGTPFRGPAGGPDLDVAPVAGAIAARIEEILPTPLRVLILGETGTGKNHIAYKFRTYSEALGRPFVEINVANLPDALLEGELFGYKRGAFTGASTDREGLLERTRGGILFLNEVGEMSLAAQAKLLTVLDSGLYRRLGDSSERRFDARLISATNRDLVSAIRSGEFRSDLFYRLAQVIVEAPPLRHRPADIAPLVRLFLRECSEKRRLRLSIERRAMRMIVRDPWPGNVRELRDKVEAMAFLAPADGRIRASAVREILPQGRRPFSGVSWPGGGNAASEPRGERLRDKVDRLEREEVLRALILAGGNKTVAARTLGLSLPGLRHKLRRFGIPE